MYLIDDVYPVSSLCRGIYGFFYDRSDIIYAVVGCGVNFGYIQNTSVEQTFTDFTLVTGVAVNGIQAVYSPGKYFRNGGLTCSPGAAEKIGVCNSLLLHRVF